jgi:hypothetical protein
MVRTISAPNMHLRHIVCTFRNFPDMEVACGCGYWSNGYSADTIADIYQYNIRQYGVCTYYFGLSKVLKENYQIILSQPQIPKQPSFV